MSISLAYVHTRGMASHLMLANGGGEGCWYPCRGAEPRWTGDPVVSLRSTADYWLGSRRLPV